MSTKLGTTKSICVGRIAHAFDFKGPSLFVDTSCSSTLVAVHLATQAIRNQECEYAIVVAVNLLLSPHDFVGFSSLNALSKRGVCAPFSSTADGYVRGEGGGALLLASEETLQKLGVKPLADIVSSTINHDGSTNGLTAPNMDSQIHLLRETLAKSGVDKKQIAHIEAHGTGTFLGDPIELGGIAKGYKLDSQSEPIFVSSIKGNLGHLEVAAGIPAIAKSILMMHENLIFPQAQFKEANPHFKWNKHSIIIPQEVKTIDHHKNIFAVSGFGMSGTNAHLLIKKLNNRIDLEDRKFQAIDRSEFIPYQIEPSFDKNTVSNHVKFEDHIVFGRPIIPAAAIIQELYTELETGQFLKDITFSQMLPSDSLRQIKFDEKLDVLNLNSPLQGVVASANIANTLSEDEGSSEKFSLSKYICGKDAFYLNIQGGVVLGDQFQTVIGVFQSSNQEILGQVDNLPYMSGQIHPATLDGCLQLVTQIKDFSNLKSEEAYVPVSIDKFIQKHYGQSSFFWVKVKQRKSINNLISFDFEVFDTQFNLVILIDNLTFQKIEKAKAFYKSEAQIEDNLIGKIKNILVHVSEIELENLSEEISFAEQGVDSMMLIALADELSDLLDVDLSSINISPSISIQELVEQLENVAKCDDVFEMEI
ncbi:MAG: polyketide synthase dehydratase domain-containing protein [Deltaproteobacteria bacterium]|nr:polyketide synthase dehydratase domain-containing protein [Deltaproteobacteria bacterium]